MYTEDVIYPFFKVTSRNFVFILEMCVSSFHVICRETICKLKELYKKVEKKQTLIHMSLIKK